jgi:hypothetical protein
VFAPFVVSVRQVTSPVSASVVFLGSQCSGRSTTVQVITVLSTATQSSALFCFVELCFCFVLHISVS